MRLSWNKNEDDIETTYSASTPLFDCIVFAVNLEEKQWGWAVNGARSISYEVPVASAAEGIRMAEKAMVEVCTNALYGPALV